MNKVTQLFMFLPLGQRMIRGMSAAIISFSLQGCAAFGTGVPSKSFPSGPSALLKSPISSRCEKAGLNGCSDLVDGALAFAEGNQEAGEESLRRGLAANVGKATELERLAVALEFVGRVPGAGKYVQPLQPAIAIIKEAAKLAETPPRSKSQAVAHVVSTTLVAEAPTEGVGEQLLRDSLIPSLPGLPESQLEYSMAIFLTPIDDNQTSCPSHFPNNSLCAIRRLSNKGIITQILASSACTNDIIVSAGPSVKMRQRWLLWIPSREGLDLRNVILPVNKYDVISVGISGENTIDARCGVNLLMK